MPRWQMLLTTVGIQVVRQAVRGATRPTPTQDGRRVMYRCAIEVGTNKCSNPLH